jgi:hypothetical protein
MPAGRGLAPPARLFSRNSPHSVRLALEPAGNRASCAEMWIKHSAVIAQVLDAAADIGGKWRFDRVSRPADAGDERLDLTMRKFLSVAAVVLGLVLIAGAAVVRWTVAPSQAVLPSDTNTTTTYTGTAAALFNPAALTTPGAKALLAKVPITTTHTTKVLATKGKNALVSDSGKLNAGGSQVGGFDYRYAVNRTDMGPGSGYPNVVRQSGLTFNWPIRSAKQNYAGWVSDTQSTTPLRYTGTAKRGGLSTYVFTANAKAAPVTDPATLKQLPASLPKATLVKLAAGLGLSPSQFGALQQILPGLPDPVPFSYSYAMKATYWVEPRTGEVVDLQERETRTLALKIGATVVPVTPVMDISYAASPTQVATSVRDARHDGNLVSLLYKTLPLGLAIGGAVLVLLGVAGLALSRRRHESGGTAEPVDPERDLQPA